MARRRSAGKRTAILILVTVLVAAAGAYMLIRYIKDESQEKDRGGKSSVVSTSGNPYRCEGNLAQVFLACSVYADDHQETYPQRLSLLYPEYIVKPICFLCPGGDKSLDTGKAEQDLRREIDAKTDYRLVPRVTPNSPSEWIVLYCNSGHHDGGYVVCNLKGERVTLTKGQFENMMRQQAAQMRGAR